MPVRRWLSRRRIVFILVGVVVLVVAWYLTAYPRGMVAARFDHARGHHEIKAAGYPARWSGEYRRLLEDRYGVEVHVVADCVVTEELDWYVDGYNTVSASRLRARFGKDIFAECADERANDGNCCTRRNDERALSIA